MSKIYEAIRQVQQQRGPGMHVADGRRRRGSDRRRSPRLPLSVPVFVYGYADGEKPFYEETQTMLVNANGGLLTLAASVRRGQELLLTNQHTQEEQKCQVVFLRIRNSKRAEVGVAFSRPASDFWS